MKQINIVDRAKLQALYGITMTDDQKKLAVGITAGAIAGIVLFVVIRNMKKKRR